MEMSISRLLPETFLHLILKLFCSIATHARDEVPRRISAVVGEKIWSGESDFLLFLVG